MSKNMGRPTKPAGDRKAVLVMLRVTPAEKKAMQQAAAKAEKKLSEWARKTLLSADDVIQ